MNAAPNLHSDDGKKSLSEPVPRLLFAVVIAVLVGQFAFIRLFGEPYPALTMPGFDGNGGYRDGAVDAVRYEAAFVSATGEVTVPPQVLLNQFPDSLHWTIAYNCLAPLPAGAAPDRPAKSPSRLGRLRETLLPGYRSGALKRSSPENVESLQRWLRGRAAALVPGRRVRRVEIRWFREVVRFAGGKPVIASEPDGVLVVPLDGDPA